LYISIAIARDEMSAFALTAELVAIAKMDLRSTFHVPASITSFIAPESVANSGCVTLGCHRIMLHMTGDIIVFRGPSGFHFRTKFSYGFKFRVGANGDL